MREEGKRKDGRRKMEDGREGNKLIKLESARQRDDNPNPRGTFCRTCLITFRAVLKIC